MLLGDEPILKEQRLSVKPSENAGSNPLPAAGLIIASGLLTTQFSQ
jgi:hypothetical protein